MHGMCTHAGLRLGRCAGFVGAALPRLDDLWSRLCRVSGTCEQ